MQARSIRALRGAPPAVGLVLILGALGLCACSDAAPADGGHGAPDAGASAADAGAGAPETGTGPADGGTDAPEASVPANPSDASSPGSCASEGTVTFRMTTSNVDAGYVYASSFSVPGDDRWWYSVGLADGGALAIFPTETTCGTCAPAVEAIGFACSGLPDAGVTARWNGIAVTGSSTCEWMPSSGAAAESLSCETTECVPPGHYTVTMCASSGDECANAQPGAPSGSHCVTVPFEYPSSDEVVGTIP